MTNPTPTYLVTGIAGAGKTHLFRERMKQDPSFGIMCATTGTAAVNLGAITIHSMMGFSDNEDMQRVIRNGGFFYKLKRQIQETGELWPGAVVVIDEKSMLNALQLDTITEAFDSLNRWLGYSEEPVTLALVGDFCQLPPVDGEFAFKAKHWPRYRENRIHLTTQYRQTSGQFLDALNQIRKGQGMQGVATLASCGVRYTNMNDMAFDGMSVFGTNKDVDLFNSYRYSRLDAEEYVYAPIREGEQKREWLSGKVNESLKLKDGARCMITANDTPNFRYVNGDMGVILDHDPVGVDVLLDRTGLPVSVPFTQREHIDPKYHGPAWMAKRDGKIIGTMRYLPIRLGYALTIHRTQGLTLEKMQFNIGNPFTGHPAMIYTALSRARSPEGLVIVGDPATLARRVKTHPEVAEWL